MPSSPPAPAPPGDRHLEPRRPSLHSLLLALSLMMLAMLVTTQVGQWAVVRGTAIRRWDDRLSDSATDWVWRHQGLVDPLLVWADLAQPWVLYLALTLLGGALLATGRVQRRVLWLVPIALVGWGLSAVGKLVVERPRPTPPNPITTAHGWSYPSGHATSGTIAAVLLVTLVWPLARRTWTRVLLVVGAGTFVVLQCLDRVYLGVHYPSDVIAGVLVGGAMTAGALLVVLRPTR